jgi:hypothetical protein
MDQLQEEVDLERILDSMFGGASELISRGNLGSGNLLLHTRQ